MENLNGAPGGWRASTEDLRNNNVPCLVRRRAPSGSARGSSGNFALREGYYEDRLPDLTMLNPEYVDPSLGYEFVSNDATGRWPSNLDNSEALLHQLSSLGIRVQPEYLTLDIDATSSHSRTASVSTASEGNNSWFDEDSEGSLPPASRILVEAFENELQTDRDILSDTGEGADDDLQESYLSSASLERKFQDYLCLVHSSPEEAADEAFCGDKLPPEEGGAVKMSQQRKIRLLKIKLLEKMSDLKLKPLSSFRRKWAARLDRLRAEELSYDSTTPDSGVHETFVALSPDEQDKLRSDWKTELAKTEDEILTLRQVLNSKVKHAHDLKRRLGITVWREFSDDLSSSIRSMKDSPTVQKANEVFTDISDAVAAAPLVRRASESFAEFHGAVTSAPLNEALRRQARSCSLVAMDKVSDMYQKTAGAMSAVGEKTGAIFGGIGAKFGQLKETPTFKSFEERVGSVYTTARSKVTGSESNSTQDFEEALREAEAEKAATTTTTDVVDVNQTVST